MNWLKAAIARAQDPAKFWSDYHAKRREERLIHYRIKREEAIANLQTIDSCIAYYEAKLEESSPFAAKSPQESK